MNKKEMPTMMMMMMMNFFCGMVDQRREHNNDKVTSRYVKAIQLINLKWAKSNSFLYQQN